MFQDLKYALRTLARARAFTAGAVAILALGIGVNSTVFTIADAMLFRPVRGIAEPAGLVWVSSGWRGGARVSGGSYPDFADYRDASRDLFTALVAYRSMPLSLGSGGEPQRIRGQLVDGSFFAALGVRPAAGRLISAEDDVRGGARSVAVLSDRLWRQRFDGSTSVLQQPIVINGRQFDVIGVAQPGFAGPALGEAADVWLPLARWPAIKAAEANPLDERGSTALQAIGRLRPGVTLARAQSALDAVAARLEATYPETNRDRTVVVSPVTSPVAPQARSELLAIATLIQIVAALVLLIVCANVANLTLARAAMRSFEISIRAALGGSRRRIARQLLTESAVLAGAGASVGLLLSFWMTDLLAAMLPPAEFQGLYIAADLRVFGFTALTTAVCLLAFGLVPAMTSSRGALLPRLRATPSAGSGRPRLQTVFVVAQLSVSLVLLLAAGLSLRAVQKASAIDLGFNPQGVHTAAYDLVLQNYTVERRATFRRELVSRVAAMPDTVSAAIANLPPLSGTMINAVVSSSDRQGQAIERRVSLNAVGPAYFRTLEIPILAGREFRESDVPGAPLAAIVNRTLAGQLWGDDAAIGRRLRLDAETFEVVGVARDSKYDEAAEQPQPFLYLAIAQKSPFDRETLLVRTTGALAAMAPRVRSEIRALDPALPVFDVRQLTDVVWQRADKQETMSVVLAGFGFLAVLLAALGVYAVMSFVVTTRTREMGVRLALGASRAQLTALVAAGAVRLALIGVVIGSAAAVPLAGALGALVFGIQMGDLGGFAGAAGLLVVVALVAALIPARRAARLDPIVALRTE
jgi:predicted permease